MKVFLFILIVASGAEINGYAMIDVALLTFFLFLIYINKKEIKIKINSVLIFCIYMILQTFRGLYVLDDIRMLYWIFFFIVLFFSHHYLEGIYSKSKLDYFFVKIVFNFSLLYAVIYGTLPLMFENVDDFQGIYWVGSSTAFIVVVPLICSHLALAQSKGFRISNLRLPSLLVFLIVSVIHHSRMGLYLLFYYVIYLTFKISRFNILKLTFMFAFLISTFIVWDLTKSLYYKTSSRAGVSELSLVSSLGEGGLQSVQKSSSDLGRFVMVLSVYDKFLSSPTEFLFGSGWYTSRFTLKPYEKINIQNFGLPGNHITSNKPMQVTGFAAIISDTGLVGLLFIIYFFVRSSRQILKTRFSGRMLYIFYLFLLWLFFLVGNPFTSILVYMLFLPNGLLFYLAQTTSSKRPKRNG